MPTIADTLKEMRAEYWNGIEKSQDSNDAEILNYIVIRLGGERFGLPASATREVLRIPRIIRVPRLAAHIQGVINLRGQVVAVTDLRPLLGLPTDELLGGGRLVVVEESGIHTALLAENVEGMLGISTAEIDPFTEQLTGFPRDAARGQLITGGGLLVLLDLSRILARPELAMQYI